MNERRTSLHPLAMLAASAAFVFLAAGYVALLRTAALERSRPDSGFSTDERDAMYLAIHGIVFVLALVAGTVLGGISRRSAMTWALVFCVGITMLMVTTMIGSYGLACGADINDVVRHWTCER